MNTHDRRLFMNVTWNLIGNLVYTFCQWLMTIIIVKVSGYNDAGILSLVMSITNIFTCFALFGIRNYQVSDVENKYSDTTYIISRIITCLNAFVFCFIFIVANNYEMYIDFCIMVYMVFRITEAFVDVLHGINQKIWRMDIVGKSFFMRGIFGVISFYITLKIWDNLLLSIIVLMLQSILIVIMYDFKITNKYITIKSNVNYTKDVKKLLIACMPLSLFMIMTTLIGTVPRIFLEKILGTEALGMYASIASPVLIVQVSVMYIFNPFATLFAEYFHTKRFQKFYRLLFKCFLSIFVLSIVFMLGATIAGNFVYQVLYGPDILNSMHLLQPVLWCSILTAITWFLSMVLTVLRGLKGLLVSSGISIFICLIISYNMIKLFGENGASYSLILSLAIQVILLLIYLKAQLRRAKIALVDDLQF